MRYCACLFLVLARAASAPSVAVRATSAPHIAARATPASVERLRSIPASSVAVRPSPVSFVNVRSAPDASVTVRSAPASVAVRSALSVEQDAALNLANMISSGELPSWFPSTRCSAGVHHTTPSSKPGNDPEFNPIEGEDVALAGAGDIKGTIEIDDEGSVAGTIEIGDGNDEDAKNSDDNDGGIKGSIEIDDEGDIKGTIEMEDQVLAGGSEPGNAAAPKGQGTGNDYDMSLVDFNRSVTEDGMDNEIVNTPPSDDTLAGNEQPAKPRANYLSPSTLSQPPLFVDDE